MDLLPQIIAPQQTREGELHTLSVTGAPSRRHLDTRSRRTFDRFGHLAAFAAGRFPKSPESSWKTGFDPWPN